MKLEKMVQIGECKIPSLKKPTPFGRPTQGQAFRDPPPPPAKRTAKLEKVGGNWPKLAKIGGNGEHSRLQNPQSKKTPPFGRPTHRPFIGCTKWPKWL